MKRLILLLLCLLVPLSASAQTTEEYLRGLDILTQLDERMAVQPYTYNGKPFRQNGCQPASVANALAASFGDQTIDSSELLLELMRIMCPKRNPALGYIDTSRLRYLSRGEYNDKYPILNAQLQGMETVVATPYVLETDKLVQEIKALGTGRFMLTTAFSLKAHWDWLVDITEALNNAGYGSMRFAMASLGAGTPGTRAPFRADGSRGHYISIYLEIAEFCETGTIYMLDSFPRALTGEAYGEEELYSKLYQFCIPEYAEELAHFTDVYTVERVSPTVLKISLKPEGLQAMQELRTALAQDASLLPQYMELRVDQLTPLQLYGKGQVFLTNP